MNRRRIGYKGEDIVKSHYENNGYIFIDRNFTIRGGEIDLIFEKYNQIVFVEVKVVDKVDDLYGYITKKKMSFLEKSINTFLFKNQKYISHFKRLDVVFVKNGNIYKIFENIKLY